MNLPEIKYHTFQDTEVDPGCFPFTSFREMLLSRSDNGPFLRLYQGPDKISDVTFAGYQESVLATAGIFRTEYGIKSGDRIALLLGNSMEAYVAYAALLFLEAVLVPLNPDESDRFLNYVTNHAQARLLLFSDAFAAKAQSVVCPKVHFQIPEVRGTTDPLEQERGSNGFASPAAIFYTSGTTGDPKGVLLTQGNIFANIEGTRRISGLHGDSVLMSPLPLFHVNAFSFSFILPLYLGCQIVRQESFFLPAFWKIVREEKVEVLSLVPSVIHALNLDIRTVDIGSLQFVISAASALHRATLVEFLDKFKVPICQAYGLSETVNFTLFTPPQLSAAAYQKIYFAEDSPPAGVPVWGNEVAVLGTEGSPILVEGEVGEIVVRGWNVFSGYFCNPQASDACLRGGYFHTGDLGFFRDFPEGRFYFLRGRTKEIVKRNGETIYLSEIDSALKELHIDSACAVGFANSRTSEEVGLYAVIGSELPFSDQDLLRELRKRLGFAKAPKVIARGKEMPYTSVGKVRRNQLKDYFSSFAEEAFRDPERKNQ